MLIRLSSHRLSGAVRECRESKSGCAEKRYGNRPARSKEERAFESDIQERTRLPLLSAGMWEVGRMAPIKWQTPPCPAHRIGADWL